MDELLALDLCDVVIEVLRSTNSTKDPTHRRATECETGDRSRNTPKPKQKGKNEMLSGCRVWTTFPQTHSLLKRVSVVHI